MKLVVSDSDPVGDQTEHLAGRGLVETNVGSDEADGLEDVHRPYSRRLRGEQRLSPRRADERLGGQVVHLVRLRGAQCGDRSSWSQDVSVDELDVVGHPQVRKPILIRKACLAAKAVRTS